MGFRGCQARVCKENGKRLSKTYLGFLTKESFKISYIYIYCLKVSKVKPKKIGPDPASTLRKRINVHRCLKKE